jgi:hypothetical protein
MFDVPSVAHTSQYLLAQDSHAEPAWSKRCQLASNSSLLLDAYEFPLLL